MYEVLKNFVKEKSYEYISHNYSSLKELINSPIEELVTIPGIGEKKAKQLKAILELSKQLLLPDKTDFYVKFPQDIYDYLKTLDLFEEENFILICLNSKNKVIYSQIISKGTINSSLVHPREVFSPAIRVRAVSIAVAHNHPSGNPEPSPEDIDITKRLCECGNLVGIQLLDHIIIGDGRFVSLKEKDLI